MIIDVDKSVWIAPSRRFEQAKLSWREAGAAGELIIVYVPWTTKTILLVLSA